MVKKWLLTLLVSWLALFQAGCATTVGVAVKRPAEVNLSKFKKVAIGEISGKVGSDIADRLTEALFNSQRFEVVDRSHLQTILAEQGLSASGAVDENTSVKLGQLLGSSAMIFGRVSRMDFNDNKVKGVSWKDKYGVTHTTYTRFGHANLTVHLQVTDLATGKIIATKNIPEKLTAKISETDQEPPRIDPSNLYEEMKQNIVYRFMKMIAGYTELIKVTVEENKKIPTMVTGVNKVKLKQWRDALVYFQQALKQIKSDPKLGVNPKEVAKAIYNIGICYSYSGDYDNALKYLNEAYSMSPKSVYKLEIDRCRRFKIENRRLREQGVRGKQISLRSRQVVITVATSN